MSLSLCGPAWGVACAGRVRATPEGGLRRFVRVYPAGPLPDKGFGCRGALYFGLHA
jgi:hypothetical protein